MDDLASDSFPITHANQRDTKNTENARSIHLSIQYLRGCSVASEPPGLAYGD